MSFYCWSTYQLNFLRIRLSYSPLSEFPSFPKSFLFWNVRIVMTISQPYFAMCRVVVNLLPHPFFGPSEFRTLGLWMTRVRFIPQGYPAPIFLDLSGFFNFCISREYFPRKLLKFTLFTILVDRTSKPDRHQVSYQVCESVFSGTFRFKTVPNWFRKTLYKG